MSGVRPSHRPPLSLSRVEFCVFAQLSAGPSCRTVGAKDKVSDMTLSMYQASVPAFVQTLRALDTILSKAAAYAEAGSFNAAVLLKARLYPDMLASTQQVQIATDLAKGAAGRLAGVSVPSYEDTELTFPELKERVARA